MAGIGDVIEWARLGWSRKFGTVAANHENAQMALKSGAALLVYPDGDYEVFRPSWERHKVDFGGRKGYVRLARLKSVPISLALKNLKQTVER